MVEISVDMIDISVDSGVACAEQALAWRAGDVVEHGHGGRERTRRRGHPEPAGKAVSAERQHRGNKLLEWFRFCARTFTVC